MGESVGAASFAAVPSPFPGETCLRFFSPGDSKITLEIFDVSGRRLQTVLDQIPLPRGAQEILWSENTLTPGSSTRFARLTMGGQTFVTRIVAVH
jgi:hypothetical protein